MRRSLRAPRSALRSREQLSSPRHFVGLIPIVVFGFVSGEVQLIVLAIVAVGMMAVGRVMSNRMRDQIMETAVRNGWDLGDLDGKAGR